MLAIIFSFLALIGWGVGDIFTTYASRRIGSFNTSFYGYFFGLLFGALYIPFAFSQLKDFSLQMIVLSTFLSIIQMVGFFAYNEGLKTGNSSLVGTISGAFPALVVVLSLFFFNEHLTTQQSLAIILIFIGLFFASIHFSELRIKRAIINRGTAFSFVAFLCWAIYFTFIKIPIKEAGFFWPTYAADIVSTMIFLAIGFKRIKKPNRKYNSGFPAMLISGILLSIGTYAFNIGIGLGLSSIVAPISGAYPALFALLAYIIYKDPITNQQKIGMIITLFGTILLAFFSK